MTLKKAIIGIFTFLPLIYILFTAFAPAIGIKGAIYGTLLTASKIYLPYVIVLAIAYIVHAYKNVNVAKEKRPLWAFTLFIGAPLVSVIYFFVHILKDKAVEPPTTN